MIEIIVTTNDVRGASYNCKESVTVELWHDENDGIVNIIGMFTNLDEWFSGFNENSQKYVTILWQGDKND